MSHTQTHTQTHTGHRLPTDIQKDKYIYRHDMLCAHSSYQYYTEWKTWYTHLLYRGPQCLCFSKNTQF